MASSSKIFLLLCAGTFIGACESQPSNAPSDLTEDPVLVPAEVTADLQLVSAVSTLGNPLPNLSATDLATFTAGQDQFEEVETPEDGLGPVFNEAACSTCHDAPVGGTTGRLETRFGRRGTFNGAFDPLANLGGSLLQDHAIGAVADGFVFVPEQIPGNANVVAKRLTTPLFGAGLVDAVPDAELIGLARLEQRYTRIAGSPHMVTDVASGQTRVGRFGWKAQQATLQSFAGDAYLNEMGFTSPDFPNENCPQGNCALLVHNPAPQLNDSGNDVAAFKDFMTLLAPPPRGAGDSRTGSDLFQSTGCATCHTPRLATGPSPIPELDRKVFQPFSDFLLHDMGRLGDGIVQGEASGREMRTAPLWGLHTRPVFLHDGRASTVTAAILAHDGQGQRARERFINLSPDKRRVLLAYLSSL